MTTIKHVTEVDAEFISRLDTTLQRIERSLQDMSAIPHPEFLTADEFMERVKVSRWKFNMLVESGLLKHKRIGRKFYIPIDQVSKFFAGEMNIEK